jgi:outer membrane protein
VLGAQALLRVAHQTVEDRRLTLDRVSALAKANLKSSLDVSFAEVALGDATLLELRAKDRLDAAYAELATALGSRDEGVRALAEEPLPPPPSEDVASLVRSALADRPELLAFRAQRDAALKMASAEKAARYPVVAAIGAVGFSPYRDDRLEATYATAGVNVSVPVLTGGRLSAREQETALRASAAARTLDDQENRIERDVRTSWLDARTAFKAIAITGQLLDSASRALDLAESRYNLGISSIVELSQAQLQKTQAEIADATARYDYQLRRADLEFQIGALH